MKMEVRRLTESLYYEHLQSAGDRRRVWVEVSWNALFSKKGLESTMEFRRKYGLAEESVPRMKEPTVMDLCSQ